MKEIANTTQGGLSVLDGLAMQAHMFSCGAAMNLLQLGRVLTEAKPLVAHGEWAGWVETNAHMPERRAQEYMQAFRKFGVDQRIAQLGPSQIIALLPMTDEERNELMARSDVASMTTRELREAIREQKERLRAEAMEEAREAIRRAEDARAEAESRAAELERREPEIPEELLEELRQGREDLKEARESAQHFAELARQAVSDKCAAEKDKARLQADMDEANDLLREQQEAMNRTQEELLNIKSAQARGETGRSEGNELTLDVFSRAVREFMGTVARMPYMHAAFSSMAQREKQEYAELLRTVEGWTAGARQALDCVAVEGGIVDE